MRHLSARVLMFLTILGAASCGGGSSPASPSGPAALSAPSNFRVSLQRVFLTYNEVQMTWTGGGTTYRVFAGSTAGASDLVTANVTGTSYTWTAPREAGIFYIRVAETRGTEISTASIELPVFTIDLRDVIDALIFRSGPMADAPANANLNFSAAVWADGTQLRIMVSTESGETSRANAQIFSTDYAAIGGGVITATTEMTPDDMRTATLGSMPLFGIGIRVLSGFCGTTGVIACAYYGPAPVGPNRSIVTMNGATGGISIAHELGHAYGLGHVHVNSSARPELNFMMNPALISAQMTEPEKNAIAAARNGGIRPGWTRSQALAAGLVRPFTGVSQSDVLAYGSTSSRRARARCLIQDPPRR